jgi:hypothetical protein
MTDVYSGFDFDDRCLKGQTPFGTPYRIVDLGETQLPQDIFEGYLTEIRPSFGYNNNKEKKRERERKRPRLSHFAVS